MKKGQEKAKRYKKSLKFEISEAIYNFTYKIHGIRVQIFFSKLNFSRILIIHFYIQTFTHTKAHTFTHTHTYCY